MAFLELSAIKALIMFVAIILTLLAIIGLAIHLENQDRRRHRRDTECQCIPDCHWVSDNVSDRHPDQLCLICLMPVYFDTPAIIDGERSP